MNYDQLASLLPGYRESRASSVVARSGRACCPSHHSSSRTLTTALAHSGVILLHCHAGCTPSEICSAIGVDESDLFPRSELHKHGGVGTTWHSALSLADAIDDDCYSIILLSTPDELHDRLQHVGELVRQFRAACRAAARKGGTA